MRVTTNATALVVQDLNLLTMQKSPTRLLTQNNMQSLWLINIQEKLHLINCKIN